jgi:AraC-like DNA-binding protein
MNAQVLFSSSTVQVSDFWCDPGHVRDSDLEVEPAFGVSFPRAGVYIQHTSGGTIVVDPTVAVFRNAGDELVTTHPSDEGDRNTELQFPPDVLAPLLNNRDRFRLQTAPIPETVTARHRRLLRRLQKRPVANPLEVEEEALSLLATVCQIESSGKVSEAQQKVVDGTRQYLAWHFRQELDLSTVARAVGSSPFHLSRLFKKATGRTITEYRTALRVRFAIDRLAEGDDDLSRLAVEAGFYDHSHMTNTFRRRLGSPPSHLRVWLTT